VAEGSQGNERERGYLVFSQQSSGADVDAWNAHAMRFFQARLGWAEPPGLTPDGANLRVVVTPSTGAPGILAVHGRKRDAQDLALADAAESRVGGGGLALLARRCPTVWLVDRRHDDDALALRLAAILASALLGPILDVRTLDLFGVKTARAKLAASE
jgi:hypothetical protein